MNDNIVVVQGAKKMKKHSILYLITITTILTGCLSEKQSKEDLPYIDVKKNYPVKEIFLTDIADVTYVHLNTENDDYLYQGQINYITENTIVIRDNFSGSILFFTKDGTPKSQFNRKGNGPEEYFNVNQIIYDEESDEVFVTNRNIILIYSSTGVYKRIIVLSQGTVFNPIVSFDEHSLFFYDMNNLNVPARRIGEQLGMLLDESNYSSPFVRISKTDGTVLDCVELPTNQILLRDETEGIQGRTSRIINCSEGLLLCNPETDTVFLYKKDKPLTPVIHKIPFVSSTDPMTYLNNCADVGNYQFMEVFTVRFEEGAFPFPAKYYMRDKKTGEIFHPKILLPDYKGKEFFISPVKSGLYYNDENVPYFELSLIELKQAYRDNKLSGKLKELVAKLNEDTDNNVFMLVDFK